MVQYTDRLPPEGRNEEEILREMEQYGGNDADYRAGRTWSLVYYLGERHTKFLEKAYNLYFSANALNPMAFKSLKRFETGVVRMTASMLNGDRNVVGTMTSGGTESCLLAVKTYRDLARDRKRIRGTPEMVVPESVHVAFEKAAAYFGVKAVHAPLDRNYRVDVNAVEKLINRRTVLVVASAPSYPHGVIDPIDDLAALCRDKGIPMHVDSCLGGFLLPFVEKLGYEVPPFDFRVPGVTSMSADVHKYGYSAKGASVILYRNVDILRHQLFVYENWPGGIFASPALLGTRPGGAIAAAWAAMQVMGEEGYLRNARITMEVTRKLIEGIDSMPELSVLGSPPMSVFAYGSRSKDVDIYAVADRMDEKGWHIDRQQRPESLHCMVTPHHQAFADKYLSDLRNSVTHVKKHPELSTTGGAATYGMISRIPVRTMVKKNVLEMMTDLYGPEAKMPDVTGTEGAGNWATRAGLLYLKLREKLGRKEP
jgi:glutamate/tyrosine decarboxylase-like PLP-dependent enzyme